MKILKNHHDSLKSLLCKLFSTHGTKGKFFLVGIWNTIFGYLVFCGLYTFFNNIFEIRYFVYTSAQILGTILAVINAYIFHKFITFKSAVRAKGIIIEFLRFCMTYAVVFLLSLILLPLIVEILHINPRPAAAILILICAIISYLGHSRFSFNIKLRKSLHTDEVKSEG